MVEVRPDEVSAIIRQQLAGFKSATELEEVGTVLQVGDGIARVYGLTKVQSGELVEFANGLQGIVLNLEEDNVGVVLLGASDEIKEGDTIKRTKKIASIKVGEGMLGRVVNTLGVPLDGKGPILGETYEMPLDKKTGILNGIFGDKVSKLTLAFFKIVVSKGRSAILFATAKQFIQQYNVIKGIVTADVTSATALSASAKAEIVSIVKKELGANEVIVNEKVDEKLIGGFILKVGDKQFDASIASSLSKLKKEFA
jgi:ATP synthase F1 delta subunit